MPAIKQTKKQPKQTNPKSKQRKPKVWQTLFIMRVQDVQVAHNEDPLQRGTAEADRRMTFEFQSASLRKGILVPDERFRLKPTTWDPNLWECALTSTAMDGVTT